MTTFHHVFTDYPLADLPAVPNGFADSSWHNDTCPSYMHEGLEIVVYMDYADPALRECQGESPRFTILCADTDFTSESYSSNNWGDILAYVAELEATAETKCAVCGRMTRDPSGVHPDCNR